MFCVFGCVGAEWSGVQKKNEDQREEIKVVFVREAALGRLLALHTARMVALCFSFFARF